LLLQLAVQRYIAWVYWLVVIMVSIFGTMAADVTHVVLGIPYVITTPFFAISLAVIFILWYRVEKPFPFTVFIRDPVNSFIGPR